MTELTIQSRILDHLRKTYPLCICWKIEDAKLSGIPDIYFAYDGTSIWFEVKSKTGTTSPIQKYTIMSLERNKIPVYVVKSLSDTKKILSNIF